MKLKSIFYCSILITCLLIWWIQGFYTNTIEYSIENFLMIHNYIKRSYYKMITMLIDRKKSMNDIKMNLDKIEVFLIPISKKITKNLGNYVRGNEIMEHVEKNNQQKTVDIFLFPDTFLKSFDYYKLLVEHIHELFQKPIEKYDNYKLLLETLIF